MKTLKNFFATVMLVLITVTAYTQERDTVEISYEGFFDLEQDLHYHIDSVLFKVPGTFGNFVITGSSENIVLIINGQTYEQYGDNILYNPSDIYFYFIQIGTYEFKIMNGEGLMVSVFVTIYDDETASISDLVSVTGLNLYPNPVVDYLTIDFETSEMNMPVEVINGAGQIVYADNETRYAGQNKVMVPMFNQPNGIYFVRIGNESRKVIY